MQGGVRLWGVPDTTTHHNLRSIVSTCNPHNYIKLFFPSANIANPSDERFKVCCDLGLVTPSFPVQIARHGLLAICPKLVTVIHICSFENDEFEEYLQECGGCSLNDGAQPILINEVMRGDGVPAEFTLSILCQIDKIVANTMSKYTGASMNVAHEGEAFSKRFEACLSALDKAQKIDDEFSRRRASVYKVCLVDMSIILLLKSSLRQKSRRFCSPLAMTTTAMTMTTKSLLLRKSVKK